MDALSKGVTPIPVKAEYFISQVKALAEDMKQLDQVEDSVKIEGNKSDFNQLRDQLKVLAESARHMNSDIDKKYPSGGC